MISLALMVEKIFTKNCSAIQSFLTDFSYCGVKNLLNFPQNVATVVMNESLRDVNGNKENQENESNARPTVVTL